MTQSIGEIENQIRDFVEKPRIKDLFSESEHWKRYDISLLILRDYQEMIDSIVKKKEYFDEYDTKLFVLVGLLQALYVQQDALKVFCKSLNEYGYSSVKEIWGWLENEMEKKYHVLHEIRQIRNRAIGHPANKDEDKKTKETSSNVLTWALLGKESFQIMTYSNQKQSGMKGPHDISVLVDEQRKIVLAVLEEVWDRLQKEDQMHREKFRDQKMLDLLPPDNLFPSLLQEIIQENQRRKEGLIIPNGYPLGFLLDGIKKDINGFKTALEERGYCEPTNYYGIDLKYFFIALQKIEDFFNRSEEDEEVFLFWEYLKYKLGKIQEWVKDIDEEYSR